MPSPLHKTPLGLLELFRLKTLGRAPDFFGDTVIPTVDVLEAYAAAEMQTASSTASVGAINTAAVNTAAVSIANFQWLWGVSGSLTMGAAPGTYVTWEVGILVPQTAQEFVFASGELRPIAAGVLIRFGAALPKPLVLRAGSAWFAKVHGDAAGADHSLVANALYVPAANLN